MSAPVVVHPPEDKGGRRVTARGEPLGIAYGMVDLVEFLRRAGLDLATIDLHDQELIDWQGGGPETWTS